MNLQQIELMNGLKLAQDKVNKCLEQEKLITDLKV